MTALTQAPLVIVGDIAPMPVATAVRTRQPVSGAALAAVLAALSEPDLVLIAAVAGERHSGELGALLDNAEVRLMAAPSVGPSMCKKTRVRGRSVLRPDRRDAIAEHDSLPAELVRTLIDARAICVVDRGIGISSRPQIREVLAKVSGRVPIVWNAHPRGAGPIPDAALVTLNEFQTHGRSAEALRERWEARAVCVTLGVRGALLATRWNGTSHLPLPASIGDFAGGDPCGAENQFAVAAAAEFGRGADALIASARAAAVTSTAAMTRAAGPTR